MEEYKLPVSEISKAEKNKKKEEYLSRLKEIYPCPNKTLDSEYYLIIKSQLENGNKEALIPLMERSMILILSAVADIYAKYDIEDIIPLDEGISYAICQFNLKLNRFERLPKTLGEYVHSTLSYYIFYIFIRKYDREYKKRGLVDHMPTSKIIDIIDEYDSYNKSMIDNIIKEEFIDLLAEILGKLTEKEREAIFLRFGFENNEFKSFTKIAKQTNKTRSGAHFILSRALIKIRSDKKTKKLKDYEQYLGS